GGEVEDEPFPRMASHGIVIHGLQLPLERALDEGIKQRSCLIRRYGQRCPAGEQAIDKLSKLVLFFNWWHRHLLPREITFVQNWQCGVCCFCNKPRCHQSHAKHAVPIINLLSKVNSVDLLIE